MSAVAALLPPIVVLVLVLGFKASGLVASAAALATAALVWVAGGAQAGLADGLLRAAVDAAVLTALVAAMIVPGILFVEATRGRKSPEAIGALVRSLHVTGGRAAILIATGIGVVVESLTGMGVSLMVTMPLLLSLYDKRAAIGIGLVGMSLMPWGALSISAHVGAKLSAVPVETLKFWIAGTSGPVAFLLPILALWFLPRAGARDIGFAMVAGLALLAGVWVGTATIGVEVAGVAGGLAVILVVAALAP
jgi:lactate permease